jgi:hypothetical protein
VSHIIFLKLLARSSVSQKPNRLKDRLIHRSETQLIVQVPDRLKRVLNATKLSIPILIKPRVFIRRVICEVDKRVRCGTSHRRFCRPCFYLRIIMGPHNQPLDVIILAEVASEKFVQTPVNKIYLASKANIKKIEANLNYNITRLIENNFFLIYERNITRIK